MQPVSNAPRYRFLINEGDLMRMDEGSRTEVWQPGREGESGRWSRYQLDVFNDGYSIIGPGHAQELAPDADLYADAAPLPPGEPVPGSGAHVRARDAKRATHTTTDPRAGKADWPEDWIDPNTRERLTTTGKHRRGPYAQPLGYFEYDKNAQLTCWKCGWTGAAREGSQESYEELFDVSCPRCETMLLIVNATIGLEETERAAAAGHPEAQKELARMREIEARSGQEDR
jgi:hypothetical protein